MLEQRLIELREGKSKVSKVYMDLKESKTDQLFRVIHKYFEEVLEKGDTIIVSDGRVTFTRLQEGYNYNKDLVTLYFKQENWRDVECKTIDTSFYSTTDNSEFELKRMILIGKVGQILLNSNDVILGDYNKVVSEFEGSIKKQYEQIYNLDKEITEVKKQINDIKKQELLTKVENEGIEFELEEGKSINELPNMDVKVDRCIYNVKGLQIVGKTTSGKSADLVLKVLQNVWNPNEDRYDVKEEQRVVSRVRMSNVEQFLQYNSDRISAS
jgi:hypothetical protein